MHTGIHFVVIIFKYLIYARETDSEVLSQMPINRSRLGKITISKWIFFFSVTIYKALGLQSYVIPQKPHCVNELLLKLGGPKPVEIMDYNCEIGRV